MSLLDFARDMGRKIFDRDDIAAERIKQHLDVSLTGIKDLEVEFDDGTVTLCGDCSSEGERQQAILIAGNVQGVEQVVANDLKAPAPEPEKQEESVEYYEIKSGDSLSAIAKRYYGDAMKYTAIFEANRQVIEDPNKIYPGQKIRIPKL